MAALCEHVEAPKSDLLDAVLSSQQLEPLSAQPAREDRTWEEQAQILRWVAAGRLALAELQGEALALPMATLSSESNLNISGWVSAGPQSRSSWGERFEEFDDVFDTRADGVPGRLRNNAGIVGAAMTAATEERG